MFAVLICCSVIAAIVAYRKGRSQATVFAGAPVSPAMTAMVVADEQAHAVIVNRPLRRTFSRPLHDLTFVLGTVLGSGERLIAKMRDLNNSHFAIKGTSGAGKSRFILSIVQQAAEQGAGITLIDAGGDTTEDALPHFVRRAAETGRTELLKRLHYFEPGNPLQSFRFDPFRFHPAREVHPEFRENVYRAWLHATADRIGLLVQLKQGQVDFEQNARLQRVLTNVLIAVGTSVDRSGRHLPLADALVLLTVDHPRHNEVYERVEPLLDPVVRQDFRRLRSLRREEDRLRETESTLNRLRSLLSPVLRAIFGSGGGEDCVQFRDIITKREIAFWNCRPSEGFSHDQKRAFIQLVIHMVLETMLTLPREQRVPHVLIIEEAGEALSEELLWALGALRKVGLSIILVFQDLSTLRREGKYDLAPKVLSQCNVVCFNETWPEDTEILSRVLFTGNLDFTPLVHEHDRPDGYDWHVVAERGSSWGEGSTWSLSDAQGRSRSHGFQEGVSESTSRSRTRTDGTSSSSSEGTSESQGTSRGHSTGTHQSPILKDYRVHDRIALGSTGRNWSESEQQQESASRSEASSSSQSEGETDSASVSRNRTSTVSDSLTRTASEGGSRQQGHSESWKHIPLARHRVDRQPTGKLVRAVNDQFEKFRQEIATLPKRQAIVKLQNQRKAVQIETPYMPDAFLSPVAQRRVMEWAKREIVAQHSYNFIPDYRPDADERRLSDFLETPAPSDSPQRALATDPITDSDNPLL